jgi:hypothetical protein
MLSKLLTGTAMVAVLLLLLATAAFADPTGNHGQPGQSCEDPATSTTPGNAGDPSNTGSPFSPNGTSGGVYADGPGTGGPNGGAITNPTAVSQYDVACFQNS